MIKRLSAIFVLALLVSGCAKASGGRWPEKITGPDPNQRMLLEACDYKNPDQDFSKPIYILTFETDRAPPAGPINRALIRASVRADGHLRIIDNKYPCPAEEALSAAISDERIFLRYEFAGDVAVAYMQYEPKRITIEDSIPFKRGMKVTRITSGGTYTITIQ